MTEVKHTEWAYEAVCESSCGWPCNEHGCPEDHFSGYYQIFGPEGFDDGGDEVDCFVVKERDARLIAAAPDMYEALEENDLEGLYNFLLSEYSADPDEGEAVTGVCRRHFEALCDYMVARKEVLAKAKGGEK